jgi:hypothetical protein
MANLKTLQQAASKAAGKTQPHQSEPSAASTHKLNTRAGKIAMTFHLPEDFKRSLRLVQAHRSNGCTFEQLAAEAFNDLFSKYNVPTVSTGNS